ncbi:Alpha/Beta hydrolase protein [Cladochytrium replicatum]|nr:Alpha/Beta hydrolase protein [Cladochytrium replicatum]
MSIKIELHNSKNENLVGRFELRGEHASAIGLTDERNVSSLVLGPTGAVIERPVGVATEAVDDVLQGRGRPVVLIMHGYWGHKDYLYQRKLAKALDIPSFRFDFRGNGESTFPDRTDDNYRYLPDEVEDLDLVIDVLIRLGWRILALVSHSRAVNVALRSIFRCPHICRFVVNVSGRYTSFSGYMEKYPGIRDIIKERGYYEKTDTLKNGMSRTQRFTKQTLKIWEEWDHFLPRHLPTIPRSLPVLTIHGTADDVVPVSDAAEFSNRIANHTLRLITGANHLFLGEHAVQVVDAITSWLRDQTTSMGSFYKAHRLTPHPYGMDQPLFGKRDDVSGFGLNMVEGVLNIRDIGRYPVRDGRIVRGEMLYHCGSLDAITEVGKRQLASLGVMQILDLRRIDEPECICIPHVDLVELVTFPRVLQHELDHKEAFMMICEIGSQTFATLLRHLLSSRTPTLIHCRSGTDYTSIFAALLQRFLEVDDDLILRDFHLSEELNSSSMKEMQSGGVTDDTTNGERVSTSRADAMQTFFSSFSARYGYVADYLQFSLGLSSNELQRLKDLLLTN